MYIILLFFFFNETATPEIYTYCHTLSLNYALPIYSTLPCTAGQSLPYRVNFVRFALSLRPRVRRIRGMSLSADLFWSFRSPYSYLAIGRYRALAASYDLVVNLRPVYPLAEIGRAHVCTSVTHAHLVCRLLL